MAMVALCLIMIWAEEQGLSIWMKENFPILVISDIDTARTILGTLIGALISLMVFSFSMVMVVLNQAANNFSPRLLPDLVSSPKHQQVLGFYIGTIAYCLLLLINVLPGENELNIPGSAIFLAVILGVLCLALFIYFINLISQSVQIGNIYRRLFQSAIDAIEKLDHTEEFVHEHWPKMEDWQDLNALKSGYANNYSFDGLIAKMDEKNIQVAIMVPEGSFVVEGEPLFKVQGEINSKISGDLLELVSIQQEEATFQNYGVGIKHIMEIILKAMSPGVNDPGTALTGINYLKVIFSKLADLRKICVYKSKGRKLFVRFEDYGDLLIRMMAGIRRYTTSDYLIVAEVIDFLKILTEKCRTEEHRQVIDQEISKLKEDIKHRMTNKRDQESLLAKFEELKHTNVIE